MALFIRQAVNNGTSSPLSVTITAAANHHILIVAIMSRSSTSTNRTVSSISCTNTSFIQATGAGAFNGRFDCEIWIGKVSGGSSGTSVSITMSSTVTDICASVSEYSDVALFSTVVGSCHGTAVTTTGTANSSVLVSVGPVGNTNDLLFACIGYASATAPTNSSGVTPPFVALTFTSNATNGIGLQADYAQVSPVSGSNESWLIPSVAFATVIIALFTDSTPVIVGGKAEQLLDHYVPGVLVV